MTFFSDVYLGNKYEHVVQNEKSKIYVKLSTFMGVYVIFMGSRQSTHAVMLCRSI